MEARRRRRRGAEEEEARGSTHKMAAVSSASDTGEWLLPSTSPHMCTFGHSSQVQGEDRTAQAAAYC